MRDDIAGESLERYIDRKLLYELFSEQRKLLEESSTNSRSLEPDSNEPDSKLQAIAELGTDSSGQDADCPAWYGELAALSTAEITALDDTAEIQTPDWEAQPDESSDLWLKRLEAAIQIPGQVPTDELPKVLSHCVDLYREESNDSRRVTALRVIAYGVRRQVQPGANSADMDWSGLPENPPAGSPRAAEERILLDAIESLRVMTEDEYRLPAPDRSVTDAGSPNAVSESADDSKAGLASIGRFLDINMAPPPVVALETDELASTTATVIRESYPLVPITARSQEADKLRQGRKDLTWANVPLNADTVDPEGWPTQLTSTDVWTDIDWDAVLAMPSFWRHVERDLDSSHLNAVDGVDESFAKRLSETVGVDTVAGVYQLSPREQVAQMGAARYDTIVRSPLQTMLERVLQDTLGSPKPGVSHQRQPLQWLQTTQSEHSGRTPAVREAVLTALSTGCGVTGDDTTDKRTNGDTVGQQQSDRWIGAVLGEWLAAAAEVSAPAVARAVDHVVAERIRSGLKTFTSVEAGVPPDGIQQLIELAEVTPAVARDVAIGAWDAEGNPYAETWRLLENQENPSVLTAALSVISIALDVVADVQTDALGVDWGRVETATERSELIFAALRNVGSDINKTTDEISRLDDAAVEVFNSDPALPPATLVENFR